MTNAVRSAKWNAEILAVCLLVGTAVGIAAGLVEIRAQDYLALGFRRGLLTAFRETILAAAGAGLKVGTVWLGMNLVIGLLGGPARRFLDGVAGRLGLPISDGESIWSLCLTLLAGLGLLGAVAGLRGGIGPSRTAMIVAATLAWHAGYRLTESSKARRGLLWALTPGGVIFVSTAAPGFVSREAGLEMAGAVGIALVIVALLYLTCGLLSTRRVPAWRRLAGWSILLLLVAAPISALWFSETQAELGLKAANPKNVIVIGIDTLRFDRVVPTTEPSGARNTAPHIAALAERGTAFSNAISQAPWTLPAFSSILTGEYPRHHGAVSFPGGRLPKSAVTLAEVLRESGYKTAGVVSNIFLTGSYGLDQGFDSLDESNVLWHWAITSRAVTDRAIEAITRMEAAPFFLFVHYFDPHYEYRDHEHWTWADDYDGWLRADPLDIENLRLNRHLLGDADVRYLTDLYDEEVAFTDEQIGRLLEFVSSRGLDSETAIVVTADHGEEFLERGWLGHTITLYDDLIRVPMITVLPGEWTPRKTVSAVVETRAVFQTLLDYLGIDWDRTPAGASFLPLVRSGDTSAAPGIDRLAFSEVWLPAAPLKSGKRVQISSVRARDWKFIKNHRRHSELLFDLSADPLERRNVMAEYPEQSATLRELLEAWLRAMPGDPSEETAKDIDPDVIERLEALGYL